MNPKYKDIGKPRDKLVEEIGEVLQALSKAERFGYFNCNPEPINNIQTNQTNLEHLVDELGDLEIAIQGLRADLWRRVKAAVYKPKKGTEN
jgi:NTP pyrophosphatase (non-canonical NTP hydrolase)